MTTTVYESGTYLVFGGDSLEITSGNISQIITNTSQYSIWLEVTIGDDGGITIREVNDPGQTENTPPSEGG